MSPEEQKDCSGHFLVVDDDADQLTLVSQALTRIGSQAKVSYFRDGAEVMEYLQQAVSEGTSLPCMTLLDIAMPLKDGLTTLAEIRAIPALANLPVLMYSTSSLATDITQSYALGASGYCVKPRNFAELMHLFAALLREWCNHTVPTYERVASVPIAHLFLDANGNPRA